MKVNYVIAVYLGPRRSKLMKMLNVINTTYHIERHLETLKTMNIKEISRITFVINEYSTATTELAKKVIEQYPISIEKEIIIRKNKGFSYGAWQDVILTNIRNNTFDYFDYYFLIEDDYIPVDVGFLDIFLDKMQHGNNIAFVAQLWRDNHASISNGLLSTEAIKDVYKLNNQSNIFDLRLDDSYDGAIYNQLHFLKYFQYANYKFTDIADVSLIPFLESDFDKLTHYGNPTKPIYIDINIPELTIDYRMSRLEDVPFINEIRNSYAAEFLHDSRTFTLNETYDFYNKHVGKDFHYIIIELSGIAVGYFRISNYSEQNNNCYLGCDIHPKYANMGIGYRAYCSLLPNLQNLSIFKRPLHKVSLEVLSSNHRAIKLYEKLGFTVDGVKRDEVYKDGIYINSVIMSIPY